MMIDLAQELAEISPTVVSWSVIFGLYAFRFEGVLLGSFNFVFSFLIWTVALFNTTFGFGFFFSLLFLHQGP
jgi:ABC-type multidrug transport system permease subunit